jgi:hypothetical protein
MSIVCPKSLGWDNSIIKMMINKEKTKKLREKYRSRYLKAQHGSFTRLCLINLFIKINF